MSGVSRADFQELAKAHRIVPIWRKLVADMATPVAAFSRIVGDSRGFLLESVEDHESWSRFSFIGRRPLAEFVARGKQVEITSFVKGCESAFSELPQDEGILKTLEALLAGYSSPDHSIEELPFWGGTAGFLGYDIVREIENVPDTTTDDRGLPDAVMEVIGQLAAFDHWKQQVVLVENVLIPEGAGKKQIDEVFDKAMESLQEFGNEGTQGREELLFEPPESPTPKDDYPKVERLLKPKEYEQAAAAAKEHIFAGDVIQVVLSERFDFDLDAEPFDVYRVLRQINPSPYMFFLNYGDLSILGSSPEMLVQVRGGRVISRPIAGTRPRGKTPAEDKRLGAELAEHPKERAEHIMLVDLARNDLGKVVKYGSLEIEELMELEKYSHVIHLTSQVSGELDKKHSLVDVLRATFPAGTVSGAPKIKAMEIIDDLEPVRRGPYAGMVGYLDFSGSLDSAIAIRTMVIEKNRAWVQAGAGIVADSDPSAEEEECQNKAGALLAAVPSARKMSALKNKK